MQTRCDSNRAPSRYGNFVMTVSIFLLMLLLFSLSSSPILGSAYGVSQDTTTLYDKIYESDLTIYGKLLRKYKDADGQGRSEILIYEVIRGKDWQKGDKFYLDTMIAKPVNTVGIFCLFKSGGQYYEFNEFYPDKDKDMCNYLSKLAEFIKKKDPVAKIRWAFSQLNNSNKVLAQDAFNEMAKSDYVHLKAAAPKINKESLKYLITSPDKSPQERSFFFFLLGLQKDYKDKEFIKTTIENPKYKDDAMLQGGMMAYGLLFGDAFNYYQNIISSPDATINKKTAVLEATKNILKYEKPSAPELYLRPINWALEKGDRKLALQALRICADLKLSGPVKLMRNLYFNRFNNDKEVRIGIITYLKFVRQLPEAKKLLEDIKSKETNPDVQKFLSI